MGDSYSHEEESFVVESRRGWRAGLVVGAAGMAALVGVAGTARWGMSSNLSGLQNKEERVQIVPSFRNCSKAGDNCISTGCCQVSGHKCFTKGAGKAQCNKTCTAGVKGFTCDIVNPHSVPVSAPLGQSLYCFSVYTENTGNETLVNHELELLNIVAAQGKGIFACEQWDVFSDVAVPIDNANGYVTIKVEDSF